MLRPDVLHFAALSAAGVTSSLAITLGGSVTLTGQLKLLQPVLTALSIVPSVPVLVPASRERIHTLLHGCE